MTDDSNPPVARRSPISRRSILHASGLAGATALAGCLNIGGGGDGGGGTLTQGRIGSQDAANEMTYWTLDGFTHFNDENENLAEVQRGFFEEWVEEHEDWKINLEVQTNLEQMKTKLLQTVSAGNAPGMSEVDSFWVPNFYGDLQPITDAIENPDDLFPFVREVTYNDGEWRAAWQNTDCRALYYRQDMMDEYNDGDPPETWEELVSVGQDIVDNEDMNAFMYNGGKWEATTFDNLAYFWAMGGSLVDDEGAPVLDEDENNQALLETFQWFKRTIDTGITPQRVANIDDYALLREAGLNDETAMFLGGNWQISTIQSQVDDESVWQNWKVSKIPQKSADISSTGAGGWTKAVFTDDGDARQAAMDLYAKFMSGEGMSARCEAGGFLPTRQSVFDENDFFSDDPYQQVYAELLQDAKARPGFPIYITISEEWQVAAGKVLTDQASPEDAVNAMVNNVNSEYEG
jgi:multiple sugar transport system substrate-binding protein